MILKKLILIISFFTLAGVFNTVQAEQNSIIYQTSKLSEHAYVITRNWDDVGKFRNNIGVVVGDDGITLVNVMFEGELEALLAEIKKISNKPIQYVFNSNWDFHNTEANMALKKQGATIVAHKNIQYFANTSTQLLFDEKLTLDIGTDKIMAYRSHGHSMGHINIFFEKANIMFMSDSYRDQWMTTPGPFGYQGHIKGLKSALKLADLKTKFIPGNTSSSVYVKQNQILKEIELRKTFVSRVKILHEQNMSVADISIDNEINELFKVNYERYPEYGKDLSHNVRAALYGIKLANKKNNNESLVKYTGQYNLPNNQTIDVFLEDGNLFAKSEGAFYYLLTMNSPDTFEFGWSSPIRTIKFVKNDSSKISGLTFNLAEDDDRYGQETALKYLREIPTIKRVDK